MHSCCSGEGWKMHGEMSTWISTIVSRNLLSFRQAWWAVCQRDICLLTFKFLVKFGHGKMRWRRTRPQSCVGFSKRLCCQTLLPCVIWEIPEEPPSFPGLDNSIAQSPKWVPITYCCSQGLFFRQYWNPSKRGIVEEVATQGSRGSFSVGVEKALDFRQSGVTVDIYSLRQEREFVERRAKNLE